MVQSEDSLNDQNDKKTNDRIPSSSSNNSYDYRKTSMESNSSYNKSMGKNDERRVSKQDKEVIHTEN